MATYTAIAGSRANLVETINAATDAWKVALTNTAPTGTAFVAGTTDLATGSGYTAGGNACTTTSAAESLGVFKLVLASPATWTFTGAVTFRYALLVDSTVNFVIGYWDYGASITTASGDTFTVNLDGTNGVFQVA